MSQFRIKNGLIIDNGGIAVTGSISSTAGITGSFSGSIAGFPTDVSAFSSSLSSRIVANEARTGSYATTGSNQFNGSQTVTGSLTATGTIVAQTLVVQTITSSVEFVTGSNRFGTTTGNTHEFTGSVLVSGSQNISGNVGIGTTTPTGSNMSNLLHVAGTSAVLRVGPFYAGAERDFIELIASGTDTKVTSPNERFWIENTSGNIIISASSGVGIGITNPARKLVVAADDTNSGDSGQFHIVGATNPNYKLMLGYDTTSEYAYIKATKSGTATKNLVLQPDGSNVGIGVTNPGDILSINKSGASSYAAIRITNANSTADYYVGIGGSGVANTSLQNNAYVMNAAASGLAFGTSDTVRMLINSSGLVSIGTTSPLTSLGKTLTVIGTGIFQNSAGGGSYNENLRLNRSSGNNYASIALGGAYDSTSGTGAGQWTLVSTPSGVNYAFDFDYNGATVIKFTTAGAAIFNSSVTAGNGTAAISLAINRGAAGDGGGLRFQTAGTNNWYVGTAATGTSTNLDFYNHSTATTNLSLNYSTGYVGIGTTSPGALLEVNGGGYGTSILIKTSSVNGADLTLNNTSSGGKRWDIVSGGSNNAIGAGGLQFYNETDGVMRMGITSGGNVGIGTTNPSSKLSLGTGVGKKLLVYDNPSTGVYSGLGQDLAAGNSTDLFAHGYSNLGYLSFGKLGTDGSTYTEWAKITTQGVLQLNSSNSPGLRFANGATNLNYYEQGSWTPSLGNATVSYSYQSGTYVRIGDYVFVRWGFRINTISGQSGTVTISGLPFAAVNWGSYQEPNISVSTGTLATADYAQRARVFIGSGGTALYGRIANNSDTTWNTSELQNGSWIIGEIFYNVP
jgi:hypothetical protein